MKNGHGYTKTGDLHISHDTITIDIEKAVIISISREKAVIISISCEMSVIIRS